jgi:DNA-binding response OmpR family regulator
MIRALRRQELPFEVTRVRDGPACLETIERRPFSLVRLDYSLPQLSGLEVLAEIRQRSSAPVLVVMVTGQGDERVAVQAMQAGAADYVVKTSGYLTALPTVVRKVLKQHELALERVRANELWAPGAEHLADVTPADTRPSGQEP